MIIKKTAAATSCGGFCVQQVRSTQRIQASGSRRGRRIGRGAGSYRKASNGEFQSIWRPAGCLFEGSFWSMQTWARL